MASYQKVNGQWREVTRRFCKVNGAWRSVKEKYVKSGGVWRLVKSFFAVGSIFENASHFSGTHFEGFLPNGNIGASFSGATDSYSQAVNIGVRVYGIPEGGSLDFYLDYAVSGTDVMLSARNAQGQIITTWSYAATGNSVSLPNVHGGYIDMILQLTSMGSKNASFVMSNIKINGVLQ